MIPLIFFNFILISNKWYTVIILFYFIKFNKSKDSLNSLKEKRNLFYFFLIEGNWWIVDLWLLPPSLKKLISSNYGVIGYRFWPQRLTQSIHLLPFNPSIYFNKKTNELTLIFQFHYLLINSSIKLPFFAGASIK